MKQTKVHESVGAPKGWMVRRNPRSTVIPVSAHGPKGVHGYGKTTVEAVVDGIAQLIGKAVAR